MRPRGCRSGAVLHGPNLCREPVLTAAEAAELGVSPWWCRRHGEELARVKATGCRTRLGMKVEPKNPRAPARRPVPERAAEAARFVHGAGRRVSRADVAEALGMTRGGSISRVLGHARKRGWIVSVQGPDGGIEAGSVKPPAETP
jgi:hypothetical protein